MTTQLFSPFTIKNVTLKNRIVMSPMCMYSVDTEDGFVKPFHITHYESRAVGQAGLIMVESTSVTPEGRISPNDLGIWDEKHVEGLQKINQAVHVHGAKTAIQLGHAGRKAALKEEIFSPSAIAFNDKYQTPTEMTEEKIKETIHAFQQGARRAKEAGFDIIELHGAHGYLINQFLSPLTNKRTDHYGGSTENRYRFLSETIEAVKEVWDGALFVRISANEYDDNGNKMDDIIYFASEMKRQGVDLIDCSSGGVIPIGINTYPGYQVTYAEKVRQQANIATGAVGLITSGLQAEEILQNERADLIFIARAFLRNPYWPKQAADELGVDIESPVQYTRGWRS
ncbi:NADPH2 dehydrogenase [Salirhabdus euzebyi]|uniref:NADPH dehydrogenase n=1 Tax=Salirhabdus euzebyi TaxID=394506 RepID=A0A841QAE5_9BACI|nr:NADPH dehydrogenase NamA [Salirhabdus euzebyi]MBB6455345.1 NADPH2 dehydrogenase [Salirhabdus euzebyi]